MLVGAYNLVGDYCSYSITMVQYMLHYVRMYELEGASSARATNWQNLANDMPTRGNRVNAWCFVPQKCERNDEEEPVVRGVK